MAGTDDDASRLYRERRKGDSRSYPGLKEHKGKRKGSHARKNGLEVYNKYAEEQIKEASADITFVASSGTRMHRQA